MATRKNMSGKMLFLNIGGGNNTTGMPAMRLVDKEGQDVADGAKLDTFRGEAVTLISRSAPHKPSSTGRVYLRWEVGGFEQEVYPSVCGLKFVEA